MEDFCRFCIIQNVELMYLFAEEIDISSKLCEILRLEKDNLPQFYCISCKNTIDKIIKFIKKCEESNDYFKDLFEVEIKDGTFDNAFEIRRHSSEVVETDLSATENIKSNSDDDHCDEVKIEIDNIQIDEDEYFNDPLENVRKNKTYDESSKLKCRNCPRSYTNKASLNRHFQAAHSNPNFKCIKCDYECGIRYNCAKHIKAIHFKGQEISFEEMRQFIIEGNSNNKYLPYSCDLCSISFSNENQLVKHKNRIHFDNVKNIDVKFENTNRNEAHHVAAEKNENKRSNENSKDSIDCKEFDIVENIDDADINRIKIHNDLWKEEFQSNNDNESSKKRCPNCPRSYPNKSSLNRHIKYAHSGPIFKCINCEYQSGVRYNCVKHIKLIHFKGQEMSFKETTKFILQVTGNDKSFPYSCDLCNKRFSNEIQLEKHKSRIHLIDSNKVYGCNECENKYSRRSLLVNHLQIKHYGKKKLSVKEVNKYLIKYEKGDLHKKSKPNMETDKDTYEKIAIKVENAEGQTQYECRICHLKYKSLSVLKSHFSRFHLTEEEKLLLNRKKKKNYLCQECGKNLKTHSNFQYHIKTHYGTREFKCSECSKEFYTKQTMESHKRIHTGEGKFKQYLCKFCNTNWSSPSALTRHLNVHGQKQIRNFICTICSKEFYSNYHLNCHMLKHTKVNNFKCTEPTCDVTFRSDNTRKRHFFRFHIPEEEKKFTCDICNKNFYKRSYLFDHINMHGKSGKELLLTLKSQK